MLRFSCLVLAISVSACASGASSDLDNVGSIASSEGGTTVQAAPTLDPDTSEVIPQSANVPTAAPVPQDSGFNLVAGQASNLCLVVSGAAVDGAAVVLQPCDGTTAQRWVYEQRTFRTLVGKKCLSTQDETFTNYGQPMVVRGCDGSLGQAFALYAGMLYNSPSTGWVAVSPRADSAVAGAAVVLARYNNDDAAQHWTLNITSPTSGGAFATSGFPIASVLDANRCLAAQAGNVGTVPCAVSAAQQWSYNTSGELVWGGNTADCLSVSNPNVPTGTAAVLATCASGGTQQWLFNGAAILDTLTLNPNRAPAGFAPAVLNANNYTWAFGRGF